ncbi:hypothetical protein HAX54_010097, partial [Datura stramonium]|nr:hypothetical protein [Datura stramonium]
MELSSHDLGASTRLVVLDYARYNSTHTSVRRFEAPITFGEELSHSFSSQELGVLASSQIFKTFYHEIFF